jgi:hypothetical protein
LSPTCPSHEEFLQQNAKAYGFDQQKLKQANLNQKSEK